MAPGGRVRVPHTGLGVILILLGAAELVAGEDVLSQAAFVMRGAGEAEGPGEFLFDFDGDEIFHVDLEQKKTVWRRPEFGQFSSFQAEGALGNMVVLRTNLEILIQRSNKTPAENVPPRVSVYPESPAELGEPNRLICLASGFSPPMVKLTWLKNGQAETERVAETDYYPSRDHSFRKFSYLTFIPSDEEDVYVCRVEHPGLDRALEKEWNANMPQPHQETTENVVCGLGLAVGIVGIVLGTVLAMRSRPKEEANYRQGPL